MVDVAHHGHHGGPWPQLLLAFFFVTLGEVARLKLGLFLLACLDQSHLRTDLGGEKFDHLVRERHRGCHHLALGKQETDHVSCAAVEPRCQFLGSRAALDDHLAFRHRGVRGGVGRGRLSLELFPTLLPAAWAPAGTGAGRPASAPATRATARRTPRTARREAAAGCRTGPVRGHAGRPSPVRGTGFPRGRAAPRCSRPEAARPLGGRAGARARCPMHTWPAGSAAQPGRTAPAPARERSAAAARGTGTALRPGAQRPPVTWCGTSSP